MNEIKMNEWISPECSPSAVYLKMDEAVV